MVGMIVILIGLVVFTTKLVYEGCVYNDTDSAAGGMIGIVTIMLCIAFIS